MVLVLVLVPPPSAQHALHISPLPAAAGRPAHEQSQGLLRMLVGRLNWLPAGAGAGAGAGACRTAWTSCAPRPAAWRGSCWTSWRLCSRSSRASAMPGNQAPMCLMLCPHAWPLLLVYSYTALLTCPQPSQQHVDCSAESPLSPWAHMLRPRRAAQAQAAHADADDQATHLLQLADAERKLQSAKKQVRPGLVPGRRQRRLRSADADAAVSTMPHLKYRAAAAPNLPLGTHAGCHKLSSMPAGVGQGGVHG